MRAIKYGKGELILTEGHRGAEAYIVERGRVEVFRAGPPVLPLAVLGPGEIFGEMALITERPRSASVRALEDVEVRILDRDELLGHLHTSHEALLPFLRTLSERVRNLTSLVEELARRSASNREAVRAYLGVEAPAAPPVAAAPAAPRVTLEGLTAEARQAVGPAALVVDRFPYRIGRLGGGHDALSANELVIPDSEPCWVSRNHCMLAQVDTRCFLVDRGSHLGTLVDGRLVGGNQRTGRIELREGPHEVRIGGPLTPFRFSLTVARGSSRPAGGKKGA